MILKSGKTKKIDFLLMDKVCKEFDVNLNYFLEKSNLKQENKGKDEKEIELKKIIDIQRPKNSTITKKLDI